VRRVLLPATTLSSYEKRHEPRLNQQLLPLLFTSLRFFHQSHLIRGSYWDYRLRELRLLEYIY
jgi:hypothetical protein